MPEELELGRRFGSPRHPPRRDALMYDNKLDGHATEIQHYVYVVGVIVIY